MREGPLEEFQKLSILSFEVVKKQSPIRSMRLNHEQTRGKGFSYAKPTDRWLCNTSYCSYVWWVRSRFDLRKRSPCLGLSCTGWNVVCLETNEEYRPIVWRAGTQRIKTGRTRGKISDIEQNTSGFLYCFIREDGILTWLPVFHFTIVQSRKARSFTLTQGAWRRGAPIQSNNSYTVGLNFRKQGVLSQNSY